MDSPPFTEPICQKKIYYDISLKGSVIPRVTTEGKVDFHPCRVAFVTLATSHVQMQVCFKLWQDTRRRNRRQMSMPEERLSELAESIG